MSEQFTWPTVRPCNGIDKYISELSREEACVGLPRFPAGRSTSGWIRGIADQKDVWILVGVTWEGSVLVG